MSDETEVAVKDTDRSSEGSGRAAFYGAIFLVGGVFATAGIQPFPWLKQGFDDTVALYRELTMVRPDLLRPAPDGPEGLTRYDPTSAQPGLTLIQGILPGGPQVRMIDIEGNEVHRWTIDFFEIWPEPTHVVPAANIPKNRMQYHTQGFWPLEDGRLLVNVGDLGTVMLDACSRPLWTVDRMTHHAITPTGDGRYWIPAHISIYDTPPELLPTIFSADDIAAMLEGTGKNYNNSIILVGPDGTVEKEFSVVQAIYDAGLEHALYSSMQEVAADPTHINDVEIVTEAFARYIDDVEPGDLLVSARDMHMLLVLDQNDGRLKWYQQGPWTRQHDPDIRPDGTVEIFNNRSRLIGPGVEGSQIVSFDPATGDTTVLHPVGEEDAFYTDIMGAQERLPNGNILISETFAGRVFEATPDGRVVWDYRLRYDETYAALFEVSMRLPTDYFTETNWNCDP